MLTALAGMILLAILIAQVISLDAQKRLNRHRSTESGLADLLNYGAVVDDGVVVCKSGALMASFLYKGEDNASSTDDQRNFVSVQINQALADLGNGWMVHIDATRRESAAYPSESESAFPDPVSRAVDEERRQYFKSRGTSYEGYFVITLTWFPPMLLQRKFIELMFDDEVEAPDSKKRTLNLIEQFKRDISNIESRLSSVITLTRLKGNKYLREDGTTETLDDQLSWLHYCITGKNHAIQLPSNPMYLDNLLASQEMFGGVVPKIGRKFIQVVAIEGFPLESTPGMLNVLAELPGVYRWSTRFIFMDAHEAEKHLENFRKKWKQKVRGFFDQVFNTNSGKIDQDAASMVSDADGAIAELKSGLVAYGYHTSVVVLMDEDRNRIADTALLIEKAISKLGFATRIESINTLDAYFGSLPGHGIENIRRPLIHTMNLSDLIPTSTIWTGSESAPCPLYPENSPALIHAVTNGSTPFRLNLHVRDLGHAIMFGPTRSGKSTHLGLTALQALRYEGMTVFNFDKGMSMYPVTKAVGGEHFRIGGEGSKLAFCPLQHLSTKADRGWAMEWIETILRLNGLDITPKQRNTIGHAIISMYKSGAKTLSEFSMTIQDNVIRDAIKQYTVDGMMGHLLDAEDDGLKLSRFTTFEIEDLMNLGEKYALPVLLYIFRRIEVSLKGQPCIIHLDEAWIMFGHPAFKAKLKDWLKAYAKKNCAVFMATQSLGDAVKSGILDVIVESTATKIFLPNINAREEETAVVYKSMGLNPRQIEIIASAIPKRQYYCVSELGRRKYELALGPLALSFVGATDKASIAEIQKLEEMYGDQWVPEWLKSRGINPSKYFHDENKVAA
jgi:type IV secretion system protein VirB4